MWRGMRAYALGAALTAASVSPCTSASHFSGVSGTVSMSPAHPGPQHADEAGTAPYQDVMVQLLDAQGGVAAQATTNALGQFTMSAPAGTYTIHVDTRHAAFPRCETVEATVQVDQIAHVTILCDSGMR